MFNGMRVVTSLHFTEPKEMRVAIPCGGGWVKHVMRTVQVPRRDALIAGGVIYVHPAVLTELRQLALADAGGPLAWEIPDAAQDPWSL